jgi:hypothetical protein
VLHDIHTPQCRNVIEKTPEIVLGVTGGYRFRHLAILAKLKVTRKEGYITALPKLLI